MQWEIKKLEDESEMKNVNVPESGYDFKASKKMSDDLVNEALGQKNLISESGDVKKTHHNEQIPTMDAGSLSITEQISGNKEALHAALNELNSDLGVKTEKTEEKKPEEKKPEAKTEEKKPESLAEHKTETKETEK